MRIELNLYRQAIEKWVAIMLLLIFGLLTGVCVWEVYAASEKDNLQEHELQ